MEKNNYFFTALSRTLFCSSLVYLISSSFVWGQNDINNHTPLIINKQNNGFDEKALREHMKKDGLTPALIDKMVEQRKALDQSAKNMTWQQIINPAAPAPKPSGGKPPVPNAICDMGVEAGWGAWQGTPGRYQNVTTVGVPSIMTWGVPTPIGPPTGPRFTITGGAGIDPCTPGGGGPAVPMVAPGFGNASIQIGETQVTGYYGGCSITTYTAAAGCSEKLTYPLTVTSTDTNFIFTYAIVMQNPQPPNTHDTLDQPFVGLCIYDQFGNPIPCGCFRYVADPTLPGFYTGICGNPGAGVIYPLYKPWTMVGINLAPYQGTTLTVEITNVDCSQQGHYAHSYWDFSCRPISSGNGVICLGQSATLNGPTDPLIAYTYTWTNGTNPTSLGNSSSLVVTPTQTDTFIVHAVAPSGCGFYIPQIVQVQSVAANFNLVNNCGVVNFTNTSTTSTGSPIVSWNWSFPGGSPATSNIANPTVTYNVGGTYTATLTVTSQEGCVNTIIKTLTVAPPVTATPSSTPGICGLLGTASVNVVGGTPGYTYLWGNNQISATITGLITGTYSVLVTDVMGCTTIATTSLVAAPAIVATISGINVSCTGLGSASVTTTSGTAPYNYLWNTTPPLNAVAVTGLTAGTYSVLITDANGCTFTLSQIISGAGANPTAYFPPTTACLGGTTTLNDGSTSAPGDPINAWNWAMPVGTPATSTNQNTSTVYAVAGTHTVTLIVTTAAGCKDTIEQQVLVYNPPVANFSAPDSGCAPVTVNFTDLSTSLDGVINSWQWAFPGGTPAVALTQVPPQITYNTPGTYSVGLSVTTTFGCKHTVTLPMIKVFPWPKANFSVAPTIAPSTDPLFTFYNLWSTDVIQWVWSFGDGDLDSVNTDPIHSYSASATSNDFYTYTICIRVQNQYGCWDTICKTVELIPEYTFYIPNTFTPNGDFMNEFFYGKSRGVKEYNIWLFDRWGNQIWDCHKDDKNTNWDSDATTPKQEGLSSFCKWDGKVVGGGIDMGGGSKQLAQEDVYVWKVRLTDIFDKKHMYVGHVSVVR